MIISTYSILRMLISTNLNAKLKLFDWNCLDNFIFDHALIYFYNYIFECFLDIVPLKCMFKKSYDHPWYDNDLRALRNLRNKIWRIFCKSGSNHDLMYYQDLCSRFNDHAMTHYLSYISKMKTNLKNNPGAFWKYINDKRIVRGYPSEMSYNNVLMTL